MVNTSNIYRIGQMNRHQTNALWLSLDMASIVVD